MYAREYDSRVVNADEILKMKTADSISHDSEQGLFHARWHVSSVRMSKVPEIMTKSNHLKLSAFVKSQNGLTQTTSYVSGVNGRIGV